IDLRQRGNKALVLDSSQDDCQCASDNKCDAQNSRQGGATRWLGPLRLDGEQPNEQPKAGYDEAQRDKREAGTKPRKKGALSGKEHPRIGVGGEVSEHIAHGVCALSRSRSTSARYSGSVPRTRGFAMTRTVLISFPIAAPSRMRTSTNPHLCQKRWARALPSTTPRRSRFGPPASVHRAS